KNWESGARPRPWICFTSVHAPPPFTERLTCVTPLGPNCATHVTCGLMLCEITYPAALPASGAGRWVVTGDGVDAGAADRWSPAVLDISRLPPTSPASTKTATPAAICLVRGGWRPGGSFIAAEIR